MVIQVKKHPNFLRDGADILTKVDIPLIHAILGGETMVDTIDGGQVKLKIPSGTQPNTNFRLRGKGLTYMGSSSRFGDILVEVNIEIPKAVNSRAKQLLKELEEELKQTSGIFGRFR